MRERQTLPQRSPLCVVSGLLKMLRSFLSSAAYNSFSSPVFIDGTSPPRSVSCKPPPGCCIDVERLHVTYADVLVSQPWAASGSLPWCQLSIDGVFWDADIVHAVDMTQSALPEQSVHTGKTSTRQNLGVGHSVFQDVPRIRRILLRWKVLSLFSVWQAS